MAQALIKRPAESPRKIIVQAALPPYPEIDRIRTDEYHVGFARYRLNLIQYIGLRTQHDWRITFIRNPNPSARHKASSARLA
jgi:hypothetical protein